MKTNRTKKKNPEFESIVQLLQAMRYDPVIHEKIITMLKLDSYPRHIVLSNWLEQLRRKNPPQKLLQALTCLFDDSIAEKVRMLIGDHYKK